MTLRSALAVSCAACALFAGGQALAQSATAVDAPPANPGSPQTANPATNASPVNPSPGAEGAALAEVVVTAQKREENLQRTPVAVTALGADVVSRSGVKDFTNIQKIAPDITVNNVVGATNIAIRGVRQVAAGPTNDTPTAVHLDGVYLARPTGLQGAFYDIQRLEVLKGPQGTLYGRNATGGVVNIITNKPTDRFEAQGEAEAGNYGLYRLEAALNAPVNEALALRGAFRVYHHDGYLSNGLDDAGQQGARLEALLKLTPKAKLLVTGDYELSDRKGVGIALAGATYRSNGLAPQNVPIPSNPFNASPIVYPQGIGASKENEKIYGLMAQLDYDLDFATLTAQVASRRQDLRIVQVNQGGNLSPVIGYASSPANSRTSSGEVRLASNATMPLQWVGGLYYFTENTVGDMCAPSSFASTVCGLDINNPYERTISYAAFGQTTYTPPVMDNALHLTLGARYNSDVKKADVYTKLGPVFLNNLKNQKAKFDATTFKVGASYDVTSRNLLFANISSGFRAGGFAYGSQPLYKPELILAYEIGSKNRFFDNRLQVNIDGFHYNYKNVETNVTVPAPPTAGLPFLDLTVVSIGKVHYTGASLQVEFALTANDRLEGDVEYLSAKYANYRIPTRFVSAPPLNLVGVPNGEPAGVLDGLHVPNTPPWTGTAAYDHTWNLFNGTVDGRVAVQWSVTRHLIANFPDTLQYQAGTVKGYGRFDVSLRYAPDAGRWNITGYVNNLGNNKSFSGLQYENVRTSGLITGNLLPPRTAGVIVGAKF